MTAHTPGPWKFRASSPFKEDSGTKSLLDIFAFGEDDNLSWYKVIFPQTTCVGGEYYLGFQSEGDAHLICAAPELLAALKEARGAVHAAKGYLPHPLTQYLDSVIAKAEGRA